MLTAMKQIIAALWGLILASGIAAQGQAPEPQRIPFSSIQGVCVGNAQDPAAGTGVTVFRLVVPGRAAVAVFGGGPASRETEAIAPVFTTADSDTVYAISVGPDAEKVPASLDAVGALSARLTEEAVADAVRSAQMPEQAFMKMINRQEGFPE